MAYNLFIAYDLNNPGQNYEPVRSRIKALGAWHQFQFSLFYVSTELSPAEAFSFVGEAMDGNDRLAVINASGACQQGSGHQGSRKASLAFEDSKQLRAQRMGEAVRRH